MQISFLFPDGVLYAFQERLKMTTLWLASGL